VSSPIEIGEQRLVKVYFCDVSCPLYPNSGHSTALAACPLNGWLPAICNQIRVRITHRPLATRSRSDFGFEFHGSALSQEQQACKHVADSEA
jgi:hypothetical protein